MMIWLFIHYINMDDIVMFVNNEDDLQYLIDIFNQRCFKWRISVNLLKTNIMHLRKKGKQ